MTKEPYLLFDAGGTLVFPDYVLAAQIACEAGVQVSAPALAEAHALLFRNFDQHIADQHQFPEIEYYLDLFSLACNDPDQAQAAAALVKQYDRQRSMWTSTSSWVSESLEKLAEQDYRMSVISNSDGRVETILRELGLYEYFEIVIDSFVVGVEKPDQRIFKLTLEELSLNPKEAIYIGDIYYVDVWGANQAGIGAVHLDKMGLYKDWDGARISSVRHLPEWLDQSNGKRDQANLFSALDFKLA